MLRVTQGHCVEFSLCILLENVELQGLFLRLDIRQRI